MYRLTPLHGVEDSSFEGFWKARMKRACFLLLAFQSLEVVETTLSCDFALELLKLIEGHTRSERSEARKSASDA